MLVDESFPGIQISPEDLRTAPPVDLDGEAITDVVPERFEKLLAHNPKVRETWEASSYPSLSEQAFALMFLLGACGLTKGEAAAVHVALYSRHGRKADGIRKAPYSLKAWVAGRALAEARERDAGNGPPPERGSGKPGPEAVQPEAGEVRPAAEAAEPHGGPRPGSCDRWEVLDAAAYREWPVVRPRMILKPIIAEGTIGNIAGLPKVGKSITVLDLLLHETHGQDWLGRFEVAKPGPTILYVAREDPAWRLKDRIEEEQAGYGFPSIPEGRLLVLSRERFRITEPEHLDWLRRIVQERGITFLVLDVLGRMLGSLDPMTEWNKVQDILEELNRDLRLTIGILDHTRKPPLGGGKASGTSPLDLKGPIERYGGADWMMMLAETDTPGRLEVYAESKDSDARPHFLIEVAPMGAPGPKLRWVADVERLAKGSREVGQANRDAVLSVFQAGERIAPEEVIRRYREAGGKLEDRAVKGHLGKLVKAAPPLLLREGKGPATRYRLGENIVQGESGTLHDREQALPF